MAFTQDQDQKSPAVLLLVGAIIFVLLIVVFFAWMGSYLTASLFSGDRAPLYVSLVEHRVDARRCFDTGEGTCEDLFAGEGESSITAYLPVRLPDGVTTATLYTCTGDIGERTEVVNDDRLCDERAVRLGVVARTPTDQASTALYRCPAANGEMLITTDTTVCGAVVTEAEKLGYVAVAGLRRYDAGAGEGLEEGAGDR